MFVSWNIFKMALLIFIFHFLEPSITGLTIFQSFEQRQIMNSTKIFSLDIGFNHGMVWFVLDWFYGISNIVDYLMPNPFSYR